MSICPYSFRKTHGFTLVEVLIVMFILTLLAGLAIPSFRAYNDRQAIQLATKQLKTEFGGAQNRSVSGKKAGSGDGVLSVWGIRVVANASTYILFSCPAEVASVNDYDYDDCANGTQAIIPIKSPVVVSGILAASDATSYSQASVIFDSLDGTQVFFHDDDGGTLRDGSGVDVTELLIRLNISGLDSSEHRTINITNFGNIEDLRK